MSDTRWTITVLTDLIAVLDDDRYEFARYQLHDAIESIKHANAQAKPASRRQSMHPPLH